jgi:hypothetical protein
VNGWQPANEAERALLLAAGADDRQAYFQIVAVADLFLPQVTGDPSADQRFLTVHAFDQVFLPVFTSVEALAAQFGHAVDGYTVTTYAELRRKWPDPQWRLAVNPGTPVDAYLAIEGVEDAATGDVTVPTMAELYDASAQEAEEDARLRALQAAADYPDDPEQALAAAARAGDVYGYLERLLDGTVLIPTTRPAAAEEILDDGFPWRLGGDAMIEAFTGPAALARSHPDPVPHVEVSLAFALAVWPEGYGLRIDPGGATEIQLPADQVLWLLGFTSSPTPPVPE